MLTQSKAKWSVCFCAFRQHLCLMTFFILWLNGSRNWFPTIWYRYAWRKRVLQHQHGHVFGMKIIILKCNGNFTDNKWIWFRSWLTLLLHLLYSFCIIINAAMSCGWNCKLIYFSTWAWKTRFHLHFPANKQSAFIHCQRQINTNNHFWSLGAFFIIIFIVFFSLYCTDFPGMCFASTRCATVEPGKTWELSPFCGRSTCVMSEDNPPK